MGGTDAFENLLPICTLCNSSKGARWLGEGGLELLRQHVLESVWRTKKFELAIIYRHEQLGGVLSDEIRRYKSQLEGQFSSVERATLQWWVIRLLGGNPGLGKRRREYKTRVMVARSRSGGFKLADNDAHAMAVHEQQRKREEFKRALKRAGIQRPKACERCGEASAIRADGGRTPLFPLLRVPRTSELDVIWTCKRCWDQMRFSRGPVWATWT